MFGLLQKKKTTQPAPIEQAKVSAAVGKPLSSKTVGLLEEAKRAKEEADRANNLAHRIKDTVTGLPSAAKKVAGAVNDYVAKPALNATVVRPAVRLGQTVGTPIARALGATEEGVVRAQNQTSKVNTGLLGNVEVKPATSLRQAAGEGLEAASYLFTPGRAAEAVTPLFKAANGVAPTLKQALIKKGVNLAENALGGYMGDVGFGLQDEGQTKKEAFTPWLGTAIGAAIPLAAEGAQAVKAGVGLYKSMTPAERQAGKIGGYEAKNAASTDNKVEPILPKAKQAFTGFKDLSLRTLEDLKGKAQVSKQYISDLTNRGDLKQPERDLIRRNLEAEPDVIDIPKFANKVKSELLPLKRTAPDEISPRYESVTLPEDTRGPVAGYAEHVYSSPIKTSAGDVHFRQEGESPSNYFAHSRVEDLPDTDTLRKLTSASDKPLTDAEFEALKTAEKGGSTRRVIEIQSDLFQKGRLEGEVPTIPEENYRTLGRESIEAGEASIAARKAEIAKLEPYRNTWHERVIREEVKKAAEDGKTKLQFPTGETAMKIEGLGQNNRFFSEIDGITTALTDNSQLKVGMTIGDGNQPWIITDVLGDGKFKAIPKKTIEGFLDENPQYTREEGLQEFRSMRQPDEETFDISGKVDTNNPIYKFYEKEVGRYLKNKYNANLVTDSQGVKWWEIDLKGKGFEKAPVEAFGAVAGIEQDEDGNIKFNPEKAGMGLLGMAAFTHGKKFLKPGVVEGDALQTLKNVEKRVGVKKVNRAEYDPGHFARKPIDLPPDLAQKEIDIETRKQFIEDNPLNKLTKYESKKDKGRLPEALGTGKGKFGKEGDQIIDDVLGYKDSYANANDTEAVRSQYEAFAEQKKQLKADEEAFKKEVRALRAGQPTNPKRSAEGIPLALTKREQDIVNRGLLERSREGTPLSSQAPEAKPLLQRRDTLKTEPILKSVTEGEAKSIEKQAEEALARANQGGDGGGVPLMEIVEQSQTPVNKKVGIIDYLRTPDRVLKKIGLGKEAEALQRQYEGYLKELPKNIDKITEWSKQVPKESDERIFKWLDDQPIDLRPEEKKVALEVKAWYQEWAERLGLPKGKRISHYVTHLFDDQLVKKEFDEDLAKIIADKIPGEVYDPFLQQRLGARGYKQSVWGALDAYAKRATRKVYMDPALSAIESKASNLELSQWNYVKKYIDRVNMRPTEVDNLLDNSIKTMFGYKFGARPVTTLTKNARQMVYRAFLGLNPASALKNLSQGANTYAKLGEKYTAIGYAKLLSPANHAELVEQGVLGNGFIQDRALSATKKAVEKIDKGLFVFFDTAERINRGAAYFGAKSKGLHLGMSEEKAIEYAKGVVKDTQFTFGSIDTPMILQSDIMKTLGQFGSYSIKQSEFLAEMAKNKDIAGLIRYGVAGMAFVFTVGKLFGMEPKDLIPMFRFGTPPTLELPVETGKAILDTPDDYGNDRSTGEKLQDIGKAGMNYIPASLQAKKTYQGLKAVNEGGSYDKAGRLQYEVPNDTGTKIRAGLFGKYALPQAQDYYDKKEGKTKDKEIQKFEETETKESGDRSKEANKLYRDLKNLPPEESLNRLKELYKTNPKLAKKVYELAEEAKLGLTDQDKQVKNLGVESGARARYMFEQFNKLKTKEEKAALWEEYTKKKLMSAKVKEQVLYLLNQQK